jgi:hypothetical protein
MTAPESARAISAEEIDREPPATAADWLEVGPEDRHSYGFEPSFIGGLPEDRITVTAEHEIAATDPDEPVPFALTEEAEAALDAAEPEAEL